MIFFSPIGKSYWFFLLTYFYLAFTNSDYLYTNLLNSTGLFQQIPYTFTRINALVMRNNGT